MKKRSLVIVGLTLLCSSASSFADKYDRFPADPHYHGPHGGYPGIVYLNRNELFSTAQMLSEADVFIEQVETGKVKVENRFFDLSSFKRKVDELRENKNSKLHAMRFYLMSSWLPSVATMKPEADRNYRSVMNAFGDGRISAIRRFLNSSEISVEDINHPELFDYGNKWSLLEEIATGMTDLIDLALEKGADPNQRSKGSFGNTPLTWSIANDAKETAMELVLASKRRNIHIDLDKPSEFNGNTPLILSIAKGHERDGEMSNFELTRFLLENGANPNKPDARGNTPLHYAYLRRDYKTIKLLLDHGARRDVRNSENETPSDMLKKSFYVSRNILFQVTNGDDQGSCSFDMSPREFNNLSQHIDEIVESLTRQ